MSCTASSGVWRLVAPKSLSSMPSQLPPAAVVAAAQAASRVRVPHVGVDRARGLEARRLCTVHVRGPPVGRRRADRRAPASDLQLLYAATERG
mmetsp:Transcript_33188/g.96795  ORF Transcript_33188/g.96795 Transcript_33188/m.96795 type:complete len:93 (+) Transcript_33188:969-1247(+)